MKSMINYRSLLLFQALFVCLFLCSSVFCQKYPDVRNELLALEKVDQDARTRCTEGPVEEQPKCFVELLSTVDTPNTKRLEAIFSKIGFPNTEKVGKDGLEAFMLVLQHAPNDDLRVKCLKPIKKAFRNKEIPPMAYANFVDRLRLHQGKKQLYGSNFDLKNGKLVMSPTKDMKGLAKRRAKIGLPTLEEYMKVMSELYKAEVEAPKPHD